MAPAQTTTYGYFYIAGQTNFTVAPGSVVTVPLYLEEMNSDGSTNSLLSSEDGLFGAGLNVSFLSSSGAQSTTINSLAANAGSPKTGFDNVLDVNSKSTSASLQEQLNFSDADGVAASTPSNGVSMVLLGTLKLQASTSLSQTTKFIVQTFDPQNGNTVTFKLGYDLDNNADAMNPSGAANLYTDAAATTFTVTTTPEPASASIILGSTVMFLKRRRQRNVLCES